MQSSHPGKIAMYENEHLFKTGNEKSSQINKTGKLKMLVEKNMQVEQRNS